MKEIKMREKEKTPKEVENCKFRVTPTNYFLPRRAILQTTKENRQVF